ncbi:MAG TPA: Rieske 2Fe-2S domain-containing protein [Acidimicrobiales bacterium]|nr:Rieske 2Fe-2S domain-containing protein [Acidimicrobiales bacterium]
MLSTDDNALITQTDPGTPMGVYFRRFWLPALLSEELPKPDCPPVQIPLLGERLVAFRDSSGNVGLLEARCPHRHANLFWGRCEEGGIRCVYHGWKFSISGECLDQPAEPENSKFKEHVRAIAYETHEAGGIIWAYLGPKDKKPEFPEFEFTVLPSSHSRATKRLQECNYLQNLEGELDSAHAEILHREIMPGESMMPPASLVRPTYFIAETESGMLAVARRDDAKHSYWRITPFLMPVYTVIPSAIGATKILTAAVPRDDRNMWGFTVSWNPDRPLDDVDIEAVTSGSVSHVRIQEGSFRSVANASNSYLIDRELQRTSSFTGIPGIRYQDLAVQEDQDGPILRRDEENLGVTDQAIRALRQMLLSGAKNLQMDIDPPQVKNVSAYKVRSVVVRESPLEGGWLDIWESGQPDSVKREMSDWKRTQIALDRSGVADIESASPVFG